MLASLLALLLRVIVLQPKKLVRFAYRPVLHTHSSSITFQLRVGLYVWAIGTVKHFVVFFLLSRVAT